MEASSTSKIVRWMSYLQKNGAKASLARVKSNLVNRLHEYKSRRFNEKRMLQWNHYCETAQRFEFVLEGGSSIYLYPDSQISELIFCRDFEREEQMFVNTFLKPGDVFVDVGANIGMFTLIAGQKVGELGAIHAFEPTFKTFERLQDNVERNKLMWVSTHRAALSSACGQVDLVVSLDGYDGWNSLAQPTRGDLFATETVQAYTWDSFADEHDLVGKVALMKIDVEGWEVHVLAGATQTLSRSDAPVLMVEFTDENSEGAGSSSRELYLSLERLGYKMYTYHSESHKFVHDPLRHSYPYCNLFAIKNISESERRMSHF